MMTTRPHPRIVLVDMDGVLANLEQGFHDTWRRTHPGLVAVAPSERRSFRLTDDYPTEYFGHVRALLDAPGFFEGLEPMAGGLESMHEMRQAGLDVRICSTPLSTALGCASEKMRWVARWLGPDWVERVILTRDKTLVTGDVLIDDAPVIVGARTPPWRRLVYAQPYNATAEHPRMTWSTWRQALAPELDGASA